MLIHLLYTLTLEDLPQLESAWVLMMVCGIMDTPLLCTPSQHVNGR